MRFRHPDGSVVHLAYCTNVHPARDFDGVMQQLSRFADPVRKALDVPVLGVGLWLAAPVADHLSTDVQAVDTLKAELQRLSLEVVTLNGFPYDAFQDDVVKGAVYRPDWSEPERLRYTVQLVSLLHRLMPDDAEGGSVSTLPLGWRARDLTTAPAALKSLADSLSSMAKEHGRPVRVAIEPEPGCLVETIAQANNVLELLRSPYIGLCLDTCHAAVQFEDVGHSLLDLSSRVVKAQLSSALRSAAPVDVARLAQFDEPRFLHQTRAQDAQGRVSGVDDLDQVSTLDPAQEWRTHFHVPIHQSGPETTQAELLDSLALLVGDAFPLTNHLEVETYTWGVLPGMQRPGNDAELIAGIAAELTWVRGRLLEMGLKEIR